MFLKVFSRFPRGRDTWETPEDTAMQQGGLDTPTNHSPQFRIPKPFFPNLLRSSESETVQRSVASEKLPSVALRTFLAEEEEEEADTDSRSHYLRNVFAGLLKMRFAAGDTVRH